MCNTTERVCEVSPYSDEYAPRKNVQVVQAATGITDSHGRDYILILNEALWMPDLDCTLLNPNQLREHGIEVQDNPYADTPMVLKSVEDRVSFGIRSQGTTLFLNTWAPTQEDLLSNPHIVLSSESPWDPQEVQFPGSDRSTIHDIEYYNERNVSVLRTAEVPHVFEQEDDDLPLSRDIMNVQDIQRRICGLQSTIAQCDYEDMTGPLKDHELKPPKTFLSSQRHSNTTAEDLSEVWQISVKQAEMTLKATTQHHIRSASMPLSRRYRTDRMFQTKRL